MLEIILSGVTSRIKKFAKRPNILQRSIHYLNKRLKKLLIFLRKYDRIFVKMKKEKRN